MMISSKKNSKNSFVSTEIIIAILTIILILVHLFLFYVVKSQYSNMPLYLSLILGGVPLVFNLVKKVIRFEFSSDILAGISIVSAVLLEQYLAGSLVVLMLSGGAALELFAVKRASFLLENLAKRMPNTAHLKNDKIIDIDLEKVMPDDLLVIYPHEICPVDGIVVDGHSVMDESYLTGEPFMMSKTPGSPVLSGAVNGDSVLTIKATKKANDSRYAKIMQVMVESEQKKPNLKKLGDVLGAYYTPLALAIAIIAWILSGDPIRFLSVIVIATPCPLLIAIPVAIIGAISLSAKHSIIIKNPVILENISKCHKIIFDKTGTLTYGKPILTDIQVYNSFSKEKILQYASSLEQYSKHPLSAPIIEAAKEKNVELLNAVQISEISGKGLDGIIDNETIQITSRSLLLKQNRQDIVKKLPQESGLECVLLINNDLAAHFRFHDTPRKESAAFISHLGPKHQFDRIMIVSGDRENEVRYLANQIGIKEVYANQSPEEKLKIVEKEAKENDLIYLGDGINDAPALAVATIGIAFGQNSDITSEAADAVVMENSLEKVDVLFHISKRMRRIALQSALFGMGFSVLGMVFAGFGYIPPVLGALSQEFIDVFAIANALRVAFPTGNLKDFDINKPLLH